MDETQEFDRSYVSNGWWKTTNYLDLLKMLEKKTKKYPKWWVNSDLRW